MEAPLVRELLELKHEIMRQMELTEILTIQAKGNRKSYLELENSNIMKQRKLRKEQKKKLSGGLKLDDTETSMLSDGEVCNEVTVASEDMTNDESFDMDTKEENDDEKRLKNNGANKLKINSKRSDDGMFHL